MNIKRVVWSAQAVGVFLLMISLWIYLGVAHCEGLKSIDVQLNYITPAIVGKDNICLVPMFRLSNPNDQLLSATLGYALTLDGQILGSAQMPTIYIPPGKGTFQKDVVVIEYGSWFANLYFAGKGPGEALKVILPLWKAMGGEEPAKLPEGLWAKTEATISQIAAEGTISVKTQDGDESIFVFKTELRPE